MLSPEMLDLLRQWWKARPSRHDGTTPSQERWLFPGRKPGKPMTTRQLNRLFHEAADAAGIKKRVTLHALRHYSGTRIIPATEPKGLLFQGISHLWSHAWRNNRGAVKSPGSDRWAPQTTSIRGAKWLMQRCLVARIAPLLPAALTQ